MVSPPSETAAIRALARQAPDEACIRLGAMIGRLFDLRVTDIKIRHDQYSLNSLNGFLEADGEAFFFKFHQEEGEEAAAGEYYRADILAEAGLPVDRPVHVSN